MLSLICNRLRNLQYSDNIRAYYTRITNSAQPAHHRTMRTEEATLATSSLRTRTYVPTVPYFYRAASQESIKRKNAGGDRDTYYLDYYRVPYLPEMKDQCVPWSQPKECRGRDYNSGGFLHFGTQYLILLTKLRRQSKYEKDP